MRTYLGSSCCFIVLISLLINIIIIIEEQVTSFIRYCEIKYYLYKAKKRLAARKREILANFGPHCHSDSIRKFHMRARILGKPVVIEEF